MHFGALVVAKQKVEALVNGGCNYNGGRYISTEIFANLGLLSKDIWPF